MRARSGKEKNTAAAQDAETRKHDPHDERQRAQRAFPQIVLERLVVL